MAGNGTALAADRLSTVRNFQVDLNKQYAVGFDGTQNCSPGISGILNPVNGGTGCTNLYDLATLLKNTGKFESGGNFQKFTTLSWNTYDYDQRARTVYPLPTGRWLFFISHSLNDLSTSFFINFPNIFGEVGIFGGNMFEYKHVKDENVIQMAPILDSTLHVYYLDRFSFTLDIYTF